jgi:UDP-glucose 4-epimerase
MKILVTGGAGFIGSHVVDAFVKLGHEVAVFDNLSTGVRANVPEGVQFFEGDITNAARVKEVLEEFRPEVIDHHAAHIQVGYSVENPHFDANANIFGVLNIMQVAKDLGTVKKIIMASTGGAMYGDQPLPFIETMIPQPLSPYGISKRSGEMYLYFYFAQYGISFTALRYSNVYGPRQNPHGESGVIAIFLERLMQGKPTAINGDGSNTRDYVYVGDVARANVLALDHTGTGEINIGTMTETSTNDVFRKIVGELKLSIEETHGPARPGEQKRSSLSYAKAKEILGWEPEVSFDEGLKRTVEFFTKQE